MTISKKMSIKLCFEDFSKNLLSFLLRWIILSKNIQKKHKFKEGDIVLYFDDHFSNIHIFSLKEYRDLTGEVLENTKKYNEGKVWDILTGVYLWLPKKKWVLELINENIIYKNKEGGEQK